MASFSISTWKGLFADRSDCLTEFWLLAYLEMSAINASSSVAFCECRMMILAGTRTRRKSISGVLFGEVDGGCRLLAVYNLHTIEPDDPRTTVSGLSGASFVGYNHDAVVVGHEFLLIIFESIPDALVDFSGSAQERADSRVLGLCGRS